MSSLKVAWFNVVRQARFSSALASAVGVPQNNVLVKKFHKYQKGKFNDEWGLEVTSMVLVPKAAAAHSILSLMESAVFSSFLTTNLVQVDKEENSVTCP